MSAAASPTKSNTMSRVAARNLKYDKIFKDLPHFESGCLFCGGNHASGNCKSCGNMSLSEKFQRVRHRGTQCKMICWRCLKEKDHVSADCKEGPCTIQDCDKVHHPLIHSTPKEIQQ